MKKSKLKGKQRIPVTKNKIYSSLIFQVASGNNYGRKIFEAYKNKPASVIARQLEFLEEEEIFIHSIPKENKSVFPMERLRIYSVDWEKIILEFINYLKDERQNAMSEAVRVHGTNGTNWLKEQVGEKYVQYYSLLDNKEFIEKMKKNVYLKVFFERAFIQIGKLKLDISLEDFYRFLLTQDNIDLGFFKPSIDVAEVYKNKYPNLSYEEIKTKYPDEDLKNLIELGKIMWVCNKNFLLKNIYEDSLNEITLEALGRKFDIREIDKFIKGIKKKTNTA